MRTEVVARVLSDTTANLSSPLQENETQLETVRRILGYNLRTNRQELSSVKLRPPELEVTPSKEHLQDFSKYAVAKLSDSDEYLVQRVEGKDRVPVVGVQLGDLRLPVSPLATPGELRWNQKRSTQLGPFLSEEGRSIWFDLYYYENKLTVRSQADSVPNFLFSKARKTLWAKALGSSQTVSLAAGHVWILAKLFTAAAGANEYVGFNIKEGSFSLSNQTTWSGQVLDFDGAFTGKLTLQLVQPESPQPSAEGCQAAQTITFQYPDEVSLEWQNGNLTSLVADAGKFTGYGNEVAFSRLSLPVDYPNGLNHLFISCQADPVTWQADFSQSRVFQAAGAATIQKAFWALPIVRVSNPDTLGEPETNGAWGLRVTSQLPATWIGSDAQQPSALLEDSLLLLYPKALFLYSEKTTIDKAFTNDIKQEFSCWQLSSENTARLPLSLRYRDVFPLIYYCHATEGETLYAGCSGQMQLDRPVFAEGSRPIINDLKGAVVFRARGQELKLNVLLSDAEVLKKAPKPLALENAYLVVSQPVGLSLEGTLSARDPNPNSIEKGRVTLLYGLLRWKPILPDPYVSNLRGGWDTGDRREQFASVLYAQLEWEQPDKPIVTFNGDLAPEAGVGFTPPSDPTIQPLPVQLPGQTLENIQQHQIDGRQRETKDEIDRQFDQLEKRLTGWKLLDVSTNMDLIGVSVSAPLFGERDRFVSAATSSEQSPFVLKGMAVNTLLSLVHVFTVPQVQWEPVRTLPEDQNIAALGWFPEHLGSASDGGPTRLIGANQALSPIIPDVVARSIRESFTQGNPAAALTTLSFGLKAVIKLTPQNTPTRNADALTIVQPAFPKKGMKGGIQLNLLAESGHPKFESRSPGFEGFMAQTLNGYELFTGTELGLSVLGATLQPEASVETQFNKEFSASGTAAMVPVTRFDLSGYGASNFSAWDNPGAMASVGKVQFKIMVGRTAFEVVKFVSKIYPWGMTVTRSVTIERRSGGGVVRKDSGWQAAKAGIFDFRVTGIPTNPYVFRPGVFRGCFDAKNIRPASNTIIQFSDPDPAYSNNVELAPVYFDATVQVDGQVDATVTSNGVLGFIQLEPKPDTSVEPWRPRLLSPAALQKLISDQGAIGGPLDAMLDVGNSNFRFRASRFEVDVAESAGIPQFVGVIRGQPVLPSNGAWSVVKLAAPGNTTDPHEAVSADVSRGTPLFIENTWNPPAGDAMNVSGPAGPYRFADPADFFVPQPRYDYGFMQNTGSQAFLFRRPVIAQGTNELSSNLKPAFADPFALFTTKGVFPPIANTIEFPTANYKLLVQPGTGKLRLNTPVDLVNPRPPLLMARDGTNQVAIEYDRARLLYHLNFDDWNAELDTFFVWTSLAGISKLFGNRFSLRAGTTQQSKLVDVVSLMKPEIRDALSFMPGMDKDQRVKDIDLGMTNAGHEIKIVAGYACAIEIDLLSGAIEVKCLPKLPGEIEPFENKKSVSLEIAGGLETGVAIDLVAGSAGFALDVGLEAGLQAKIPISGIFFLVLGLEVGVGWSILPTSSSSLEIAAYVGVGVGGSIGPFKAEAFLAAGLVFVYEDETAKFGGLVMLEAEVDLKIVEVGISAELKGVYYKGDDPDTAPVETDVSLIDASGEVAVNISIFLVININASYEYATTIKP